VIHRKSASRRKRTKNSLDSDSDEENSLPFLKSNLQREEGEVDEETPESEEELKAIFKRRLFSCSLSETVASLTINRVEIGRHFDAGAFARSALHCSAAVMALEKTEGHDHAGLSSLRLSWSKARLE